jgi:hypothetical protein
MSATARNDDPSRTPRGGLQGSAIQFIDVCHQENFGNRRLARRWPLMARLRHANRLRRSPVIGVDQKSSVMMAIGVLQDLR